jgi:glycosyltransferase involved in cell wall biosynthesis
MVQQSRYGQRFIFAIMKLAVFALFAGGENNRESKNWIQQLTLALAKMGHFEQVILYTDEEELAGLSARNLHTEWAKPARFFWNRWQQHRLWRSQLQQQSVQSVLFLGLKSAFATPLPSHLILHAPDFGHRRQLSQKLSGAAFKKVFVASHAALNKIALPAESKAQNITVLHGAPPEQNLEVQDTQLVKDRYTDGAEYFLYHASFYDTDAAILLLKAFSRFKRRQKSSWKLVLAPEEGPGKLKELLATYKYRHDVVMVHSPGPEMIQALYAGAYCFVQPAAPTYFGTALLRSLSWSLPIIATGASREWAGSAALYFDEDKEENLAENLMALYKDEALRQKLVQAAAQQAAVFSWQPLIDSVCSKK